MLILSPLKTKFKHYNQNQTTLLPYSFDEFIVAQHPVRIVNQVVESINIKPLLKAYSEEGNPAYHPKMLLKVMLYAYMNNVYSSRKIELAIRENIKFYVAYWYDSGGPQYH